MTEHLSERELKLEARVHALESLVAMMWAVEMSEDSDPQGFANRAIENAKKGTAFVTFPELDPAQSDQFAQMLQEAVVDVLQRAKQLID